MGRISQRSKRRAEKEFNIYFKSMEKEKKQTAVEWLIKQIYNNISAFDGFGDIIKQAKEMEKEQIEEAYSIGYTNCEVGIKYREQYYNETFKK